MIQSAKHLPPRGNKNPARAHAFNLKMPSDPWHISPTYQWKWQPQVKKRSSGTLEDKPPAAEAVASLKLSNC
jgi:hypothetical protein